jgi:hypothetical protein
MAHGSRLNPAGFACMGLFGVVLRGHVKFFPGKIGQVLDLCLGSFCLYGTSNGYFCLCLVEKVRGELGGRLVIPPVFWYNHLITK